MKTMERPGIQAEMERAPETIKSSYKGSEKLRGKIALITGGDSGIGRSVAVHFAKEGADVAIAYLNEDTDAEETKMLVEKKGQKCIVVKGDLINYRLPNQFHTWIRYPKYFGHNFLKKVP